MSIFGPSHLDKMQNKIELLTSTVNALHTNLVKHMEHEEVLDKQKMISQAEMMGKLDKLFDSFSAHKTLSERRHNELSLKQVQGIADCQKEMKQWIKDDFVTKDEAKILKDDVLIKAALERQRDLENYASKNDLQICSQQILSQTKEDRLTYGKAMREDIEADLLKRVNMLKWIGGAITLAILFFSNFKFTGAM